ncbi:MAG TPA: hypothetical protein VGE22_14835 [Solimonas sp.]
MANPIDAISVPGKWAGGGMFTLRRNKKSPAEAGLGDGDAA